MNGLNPVYTHAILILWQKMLSSRFATAETVYRTPQLHAFKLVKKAMLNTKVDSVSPNYTENMCKVG
jgi:hypothetical protein